MVEKKILIVEDSQTGAKDLKEKLLDLDYLVAGISVSAEEAIQMAVETKPDLILMDIILEDKMDGIEAALNIQKKLDIPVVYITAYSDHRLDRILESNPYGYIMKPVGNHVLKLTLEMAFFKHQTNLILKDREERLKESVKEKEMLLKEVLHRVKNNYATLISLINLQLKDVQDEKSKRILMDIDNRIRTMSLIHEKLYKSQDIKKIDFGDYIKEISRELFNTYIPDKTRITLNNEVENIKLNMDQAIPCGLLLSELLTNSFKYAFPKGWGKKGEISVKFYNKESDMAELVISDNGIGLPAEMNIQKFDTLGLKLVQMLTLQLNGSISICSDEGSSFKISFPVEK